jgi:hypothetical protein
VRAALPGRKEGLLFLKKETKNFCSNGYAANFESGRASRLAKVFWFFFSKNNNLSLRISRPPLVLLSGQAVEAARWAFWTARWF